MAKWLGQLVRDIRGNAAWDAIKWLWCSGGAALTEMIHAVVSWWRGHPDNMALVIGGIPAVLFLIVFVLTKKDQEAQTPERLAGSPSSTEEAVAPAGKEPFLRGRWGIGWRIEAAVLGNEGDGRKVVTTKLLSLIQKGKAEIPANHYELCDGVDPAPGRPKFLTVTLTNTVRQEETWKVPHKLLGTVPAGMDISNKVIGDFNTLTWAQRIALARIAHYGAVGHDSLVAVLSEWGFGKAIEDTIVAPLLKTTLVEEDGQRMVELKAGREDAVRFLISSDPPS